MSAGQKISRDQLRRYARGHVIGVKEISGNMNCPLDPSPCPRERDQEGSGDGDRDSSTPDPATARNVRHEQTNAEAKLWARLRGGQLEGSAAIPGRPVHSRFLLPAVPPDS